jgi:manganese efflux pump family protein
VSLFEIIVVAIALAMDAFAVSIAAGVTLRRVSGRQTLRLSLHFGLFQALMPILGYGAGLTVQKFIASFDHWIAFGLLAFIGGRMIVGAVRNDEEQIKNAEPTKGWSLVMLSVATSIDALAVGLSLAMLRVSVWFPATVIGLVAGVFTACGIQLGGYLGRRLSIARYALLMGGVVLLIIGGSILHQHGVFIS